MKKILFLILVSCCIHAIPSFAAESEADEGATSTMEEEGTGKTLDALLELRPSWTLQEDRLHTENSTEVWWRPNPNRELRYIQYWNTNLANFQRGGDQGVNFELEPGWLVFKAKNLWESEKGRWTLDAEPTLVAPTWATDRRAGKLVELRAFLKLTKEFNDRYYFTIYEAPTFFAYSQAGSEVDEEPTANPIAENRLYLVAGINITPKMNFEFPIWIMATRYRQYQEDAKYNNSWGAFVMIWPELDWQVDPHLTVGVSYYSDNFVAPDLSEFTFKNAFDKGAAQVVLRATL